jgi:hypothetical protein
MIEDIRFVRRHKGQSIKHILQVKHEDEGWADVELEDEVLDQQSTNTEEKTE